jgi:hypothetical protein
VNARSSTQRETVTAPSQRLNRLDRIVRVELLAQATDEDFDDIAVALEVLIVQAIGQLGFRYNLPRTHHQVLHDLVLEAREIDNLVIHQDILTRHIQRHRTSG